MRCVNVWDILLLIAISGNRGIARNVTNGVLVPRGTLRDQRDRAPDHIPNNRHADTSIHMSYRIGVLNIGRRRLDATL